MKDRIKSAVQVPPSPGRSVQVGVFTCEELLAEIASGNDRAFGALYDQLAGRLWGLTRHILRDAAQAGEVTQEVFVELWRTASKYSPEKGTVAAWAMTMAHRQAVDRVRAAEASGQRERRVMFESARERPFDQVSERALEDETYHQVTACLDQLTERQRETILLAYYGGQTCQQIAEASQLSTGTIKSTLHSALRRLRTCVDVAPTPPVAQRRRNDMTDTPQSPPADAVAAVGGREQRLARTFVALADTLVDEFDVLDFLRMLTEQCVELLNVSAAGVILIDERGGLRVAAASSERAELLEVLAVQTEDGPCIDCVQTATPVASADLSADADTWPRFGPAAGEYGFRAAQAVPMRLRGKVVGALSLLNTEADGVDETSTELGQALADVATIGILQQRAIEHHELVSEQLQTALNSRVVIEQAKGILAARGDFRDTDTAFTALRGYARAHNRRLSELARAVVDSTVDLDAILAHAKRMPR